MHIILISGGSGKRLWPLSNDIRSKQFIPFFQTEDGGYESMVQRIYRQIKRMDVDADITIATSKSQVSSIRNQLGMQVGISVEPCRRDTFPAISLATAYLTDVKGVSKEEVVIVCPVDPYVEDDYFKALRNLSRQAEKGEANLVLLGIEPTYPSEKYGYIIPEDGKNLSYVQTFKEKPDEELARHYIAEGALWNGGVFAYRLSYLLEKVYEQIGFSDYSTLLQKYETLEKISFDYAVVEKEKSIQVMRFSGRWKDLGTWNTLVETMNGDTFGNARIGRDCRDVHIINELGIPILVMGMKDVVVCASAEGVLVSDKGQSSYIKPYVDEIDQPVMFVEKSWGSYRVIDIGSESMTVKVMLNPGHGMNYHSHQHRDEIWVVIEGNGKVVLDEEERKVCVGDVVTMKRGCKHTVLAETRLQMVEVQVGERISEKDKRKYPYPLD